MILSFKLLGLTAHLLLSRAGISKPRALGVPQTENTTINFSQLDYSRQGSSTPCHAPLPKKPKLFVPSRGRPLWEHICMSVATAELFQISRLPSCSDAQHIVCIQYDIKAMRNKGKDIDLQS